MWSCGSFRNRGPQCRPPKAEINMVATPHPPPIPPKVTAVFFFLGNTDVCLLSPRHVPGSVTLVDKLTEFWVQGFMLQGLDLPLTLNPRP